MVVSRYEPADCKGITELFYETVHAVNAKDYTKEQLDAWASGKVDPEEWNRTLSEHFSLVALEDGRIVGFGDMDQTGYLDRLYVHKDYQGRGIASALCKELENAVREEKITVHASITAVPFFRARGYEIVRKQQVIRQGISLTNYIMEKQRREAGADKGCGAV